MSRYKTGLVLSGGGTRGIAHAGVLKFLREQHVTIDAIAGTSAGAIVGAMAGFGKKPVEILEFFQSIHFFNWHHLVFNRPGIVGSKIFSDYLMPVFGDAKIKNSAIPLFITGTDLRSGKLHVFGQDERVVDALIATSAIPGIATPYRIDGNVYCDGGILNNFPVDLLEKDTRKIIGVYLSPLQTKSLDEINTLRSVAERALEILLDHTESPKFELCDWLIPVDRLNEFGRFETDKLKTAKIFDIGYEAAKNTFNTLSGRTKRILSKARKRKSLR